MKGVFSVRGFLPFLIVMFINAVVDLGHKITIQNILFKSIEDENLQIILTSLVNLLILLPYIMLFSVFAHPHHEIRGGERNFTHAFYNRELPLRLVLRGIWHDAAASGAKRGI